MSIMFKDSYATVWEVEDKGNYAKARISTSRKDNRDDSYINSNWFATFVGNAYANIGEIGERTRIKMSGRVGNEPSKNDASKFFVNVTVFDFEVLESNSTPAPKKQTGKKPTQQPKKPAQKREELETGFEIEDDDLPF